MKTVILWCLSLKEMLAVLPSTSYNFDAAKVFQLKLFQQQRLVQYQSYYTLKL